MSHLVFKFVCQVIFRDFNKAYSKDDILVFTTPHKCVYIYILIGKTKRKSN